MITLGLKLSILSFSFLQNFSSVVYFGRGEVSVGPLDSLDISENLVNPYFVYLRIRLFHLK